MGRTIRPTFGLHDAKVQITLGLLGRSFLFKLVCFSIPRSYHVTHLKAGRALTDVSYCTKYSDLLVD